MRTSTTSRNGFRKSAIVRAFYVSCVLGIALLEPGCASKSSVEFSNTTNEKQFMEIKLDQLSFKVPSELKDVTNYTFRNRADTEKLMVISGKPPAGAMNSSEILAVGRDHLESVMADKVTIEPETDGRIANLPAKQFSFTFEDNGKSFRERWAVASVNQSRFVQISYTTRADDGKAASRFEHITQTSLLAETELSLPASKDEYIRRNAAELSLDVPRALLAPVTYLFTSQDELINIGLTVDDFSNSDQPRLTPEERIQSWTTDSSKISEPKSSPLVVGEGKGTLVGCTVVTGFEPDITRFARREGVLAFPGLLRISLTGKSSPELEPELDRILSVLINSITLSR